MLKRLLASIALLSLILAGVLLVYWWRSRHGHIDHILHLGGSSANQTDVGTVPDKVTLEVTQNFWNKRMDLYPFKDVLGGLLIFPCLWMAIKVRSWLPRPPGRRL